MSPTKSGAGSQATVPLHFVIWIELTDGRSTILPVALHIIGSRNKPFILCSDSIGTDRFRKSKDLCWPWDVYTEPQLQNKFTRMPLLNISDANLLLPIPVTCIGNADFIPRRFTHEWLLKASLQPGDLISPTWLKQCSRGGGKSHTFLSAFDDFERVLSVSSLIDRVLNQNCFVKWNQ